MKIKLLLGATFALFIQGCSATGTQGALACGAVGAGIGALAGGQRATIIGGLVGAAACGVAGEIIDQKRREALERERNLDAQIADQNYENYQLAQANRDLENEIVRLERESARLATLRQQNEQEATEVEADIEAQRLAASGRLEIVEARIQSVDEKLARAELTLSDRNTLTELRENLAERAALLARLEQLPPATPSA